MSRRVTVLVLVLAATPISPAAGDVGSFEGVTDVGGPALKGQVGFDPTRKTYRVTGGGANIWNRTDEFLFVWRRLSGDVTVTATLRFESNGGAAHRKAGLMIRRGLEADAPYVDAAVHGDGLTSLQFRDNAGDITRGVNFPVVAPSRIKLERRRNVISLWTAQEGGPLREAGSVQVPLGAGPVYVGLFVCSHDPKALETVSFSDVSIETETPPAAERK